jgi:hypothetical protein
VSWYTWCHLFRGTRKWATNHALRWTNGTSEIGSNCPNNKYDCGGGNKNVLDSNIVKRKNAFHVGSNGHCYKLCDLALDIAQIGVAQPSAKLFYHILIVSPEFEMDGSARA